MKRAGVLSVISGFSGVGKGTIVKKLVEKEGYALSVSATSRAPRQGEVHGREYFFLTREEFHSMIENNGLIEWAEYVSNFYGTPREYVEERLAGGEDVILEIEPQGALKVKAQYPEAVLIFIVPPNVKELENRLIGRGTEETEIIKKRLKRAAEETAFIENYEYIVINDDLEDAVSDIHHIIQAASHKRERLGEFVDILTDDLKKSF
ncbi:guanylate kinase [Catonella morbi ATCC 51271]|uniref:Guanylate kinase n=1 Tax=Catonella morbi ATCC 51271 TaxID=592026 RepID=V2XKI9_9FIRM|nr:guanylate kinase [Catonella morbi]ESL02664.1 guanylate kinase [Catonella morbi ATCC 51271]